MRSKLFTGLAVIVATFLLVTNPVLADAAKQITGKQIKDNSVTGKDVKDGSLSKGDLVAPLNADTATNATHANDATHASDATTLSGQTAGRYLNQTYSVGTSTSTGVTTFSKSLPTIPNGDYLVTVDLSAGMSVGGATLSCEIDAGPTVLMHMYGVVWPFQVASINAAQVMTVAGALTLLCGSSTGTFTSPYNGNFFPPNSIAFTRLDTVTSAGTAN